MATPLVSVCIPAFNAAMFLEAALDSVLSQSYRNIQVIVVNDGSTDRSRDILRAYDSHVTVIDQSNRGQCAAANRALAQAGGELIKFFDADDVLEPDMIARQVEILGGRTDAVALGEWTRFYGSVPSDEQFELLSMYRNAKPVDWLVSEWTQSPPMMQCALWLIPRPVITRAGYWDERLSLINDFEYFTRVLLASEEVLYASGARMFYRSGLPGSLSGQKSRKAIESQLLSLLLGTAHLLTHDNSSRAKRACANIIQSFEYEHYPNHRDLLERARTRVRELGGSDVEPIGPPNFHRLRRIVGWRAARAVQKLLRR